LNIRINEKRVRFDALLSPEVSSAEVDVIFRESATEGFIHKIYNWLNSKDVLGIHKNAETGWDIEYNKGSIRSIIKHRAKGGKAALMEEVPTLIKSGIHLEAIPDPNKKQVSHMFAAKATIDETPYAICFVVREDRNGRRYYDHSLTKTETLDRIDGQAPKIADGGSEGLPPIIVIGPDANPTGKIRTASILKRHLNA
jgi:hypothetical protein